MFNSASTSGVPATIEALSYDWHRAVERICMPHPATAPAFHVAGTACLAASTVCTFFLGFALERLNQDHGAKHVGLIIEPQSWVGGAFCL